MYRVRYDVSEFEDYSWTEFFKEFKTVSRKKYFIFGKTITKEVPNVLFNVNIDIENTTYTKDEVRNKIERQYELSGRKEEIARGEII